MLFFVSFRFVSVRFFFCPLSDKNVQHTSRPDASNAPNETFTQLRASGLYDRLKKGKKDRIKKGLRVR